MSLDVLYQLFLTLIAPLLSVGVIKKILRVLYTAVTGQVTKLPHGVKLALGIFFGIGFAVFAQTGFDPRFLPYVNPILTIVLALASNKIYDVVHNLLKKK